MKKQTVFFIAIIAILTISAVTFFWINSTGKLQRKIDNLNGQVTGLQQSIKDHETNILKLDSLNGIKSDSLKALKRQLKVQQAENAAINRLYEIERAKIAKLSDSASLDYFKSETAYFPTYSVKIDSGAYFAVTAPSIRIANDKFLRLKEKTDLLVNMTGQCNTLLQSSYILQGIIDNREAKIAEMSEIDKSKSDQIRLLQQSVSGYEKFIRKEKRKKTLYKITTGAGIVAAGYLLLR